MPSYTVPYKVSFEDLARILTPLLVPGDSFTSFQGHLSEWHGIVNRGDCEKIVIKWSRKKDTFLIEGSVRMMYQVQQRLEPEHRA
jgi:hypothetical protein